MKEDNVELVEQWTIEVSLPSYDPAVLQLLGIAVSTKDKGEEEIFIPNAGVNGVGRYMRLLEKGLSYSQQPSSAIQEAVRTFEAGLPPPWAWRLARAIVELRGELKVQ